MKKQVITFLKTIPNIAKYVSAVGTVVLLSLLFPTNTQFKYSFEQGTTWQHDDLTSDFDFAINKTEEEVNKDKALISAEAAPYYELKTDLIKDQQKEFLVIFEEQIKIAKRDKQYDDVLKNPKKYEEYGKDLLRKYYNRGILGEDTLLKNKEKTFVINVLKNNIAEKQSLQGIITKDKLTESLNDSLMKSGLQESDFLFVPLEASIKPNLIFNDNLTKKYLQEQIEGLAQSKGMVKSGDLIIQKGQIIGATLYQKLISYKKKYEAVNSNSQRTWFVVAGYFLLVGLTIFLFLAYLRYHAPTVFIKLRWVIFLLFWVLLYTFLMYGIKETKVLDVYMLPFCIAPIVIKNFHNRELAFITHIVILMVIGIILTPSQEFLFMQIAVGLITIFSRSDTRYWASFFRSIFLVILTYSAAHIGLSLIHDSSLEKIKWQVLIWILLNGFLTLLAYPLIPLLGRLFGFYSSITLAELSDLNHPLLKDLSMKTPGTLQHSLQVSNLSEAAATAIGANPLLVKVGALYHDIGKTVNPLFFIENLGNNPNPHEQKDEFESAKIIISHVSEGVRLARMYGLPDVIQRFILTHHGNTMVEFFYHRHISNNPQQGQQNKTDFQYIGPLPESKEETILMLADSIEATAKSLQDKTQQNIDNLVERICNDKVQKNQLTASALTFDELEKCKKSFKQTLNSIYHVRIEYPI